MPFPPLGSIHQFYLTPFLYIVSWSGFPLVFSLALLRAFVWLAVRHYMTDAEHRYFALCLGRIDIKLGPFAVIGFHSSPDCLCFGSL